jgi:hypothetical protein
MRYADPVTETDPVSQWGERRSASALRPTGYCGKERKRVEIQNPQWVTMKNGRPAIRGTCAGCGTEVFKPVNRMTPNQIVAWNLRQARLLHGWTQERAAKELEPYLGERWSKASFSAAERSYAGERVRQFTADDLYAFARAFDLPITFFLTPMMGLVPIGHARALEQTSTAEEFLDLVFDLSEPARTRLLEAVGMTEEGSRALRRWADDYAAVVAARERFIEEVLTARAPLENDKETE